MTGRNQQSPMLPDGSSDDGSGGDEPDVQETFVSILSHDLQNPLNVADLHLELARREHDSEDLEIVDRALDRLEALVADLLQLAEGGNLVNDLQPVELPELGGACWNHIRTADATLVCQGECTVRADPGRLEQLLENLFLNAVVHGGDDVTVAIGCLDDETGFFVEDDGAGISVDRPRTVFDPGMSTSNEGTGYGLYIVSVIARAHGWEYRVSVGSDGGARFEFVVE